MKKLLTNFVLLVVMSLISATYCSYGCSLAKKKTPHQLVPIIVASKQAVNMDTGIQPMDVLTLKFN